MLSRLRTRSYHARIRPKTRQAMPSPTPEELAQKLPENGSIWSSYMALPPLKRLAVTLSFTVPGMLGLYLIGDDIEPQTSSAQGEYRNQENFFEWCLRMAREDWQTARERQLKEQQQPSKDQRS